MATCKEGERKACILSLIKNHEHQPISTSLFIRHPSYSIIIHPHWQYVKPKHNSVNKFLLQTHGQAQTASTMQCRICYLSHCATTWMITKNISKTFRSTFVLDFKNLLIPLQPLQSDLYRLQHHPNPWDPSCETSKPAPLPRHERHDDFAVPLEVGGCVLIKDEKFHSINLYEF